jgi:hypothetical protein
MIPDRRARLAVHEGVAGDAERDNDQRCPREGILAARAGSTGAAAACAPELSSTAVTDQPSQRARRRHPLRPALLVGSCTQ